MLYSTEGRPSLVAGGLTRCMLVFNTEVREEKMAFT
jgi:hypothetical protein